jgi:DNA primase
VSLFPQTFIDDLRLQANIVQVVQEYVPLKRAGTTYKGLCPFHSERTPSFQVNPDKGFFYCFGCHVGGDVFKFVELHEKVAFPDAVKLLAQKFGVSLPERTEGGDDDQRRDASLREALLKMHEVAAAYFREQLAAPGGARARQQLAERGVAATTIEQLGLGYAPPARDGLKARLLKQGFSTGLLVQSGLVSERESGELADRFRNRLMVPICRDTGSVIAFGGRTMEANQQPKYLNSPETAVYSKGRTLYGLNLTKGAIRKLGYALLVEGYFDFAQVFQSDAFPGAGAPVIASCGTALTVQQAQLLRRFTTNVKLNFDPDTAGQGAATRSCELLVREGFEVKVVVLDKGEDPDTFLQRHGAERYREKLRTSSPYLEYLTAKAAAGLDFRQPDTQRKFLADMLAIAAWLPEATMRDQFADKVAHAARITGEVVQAEFRKIAAKRQVTLAPAELPSLGEVKSAEKALIWWLVQRPDEARTVLGTLDDEDLRALAARRIFDLARSLQEEPAEHLPSALIQRLNTVDAQLVTKIASEPAPPVTSVNDCVREIKRLRCDRERAALQREIDRLQELGATQHGTEIDNLWQRKKDLLHRIEALT